MSWRNASSLIVIARKSTISRVALPSSQILTSHNKYDYGCMLLRRSAKSNAFAKSYVFPGGVIDQADLNPSWLDHFANYGSNEQMLKEQFCTTKTSHVPIYESVASKQRQCIPEVACRITAIREAFEETGVLFCQSKRQGEPSSVTTVTRDLSALQEQVHGNADEFLRLNQKNDIYPNIWDLHEWSNWLTPKHLGSKRFDTIFYICFCDSEPNVNIDNKEITDVQWLDPLTALKEHFKGSIQLAPPQVYELSRLANIEKIDVLKEFVTSRSEKGVQRWLPVGFQTESGLMTVLPGDSLYPEKGVPGESEADTQHDFDDSSVFKHRMLFARSGLGRIACNIEDPHGHLPPIEYSEVCQVESTRSKM